MPRAKPKTPAPPAPEVQWPADAVSRRPVGDLIPYDKNARMHSVEQIEQIAKSIGQWGWTMPVLVDETSIIIAGHARVQAAQKLGLDDVPVMVATGWSEAQKRAYVIADNKLTMNADWDWAMLRSEFAEIDGIGDFDLTLTGFSSAHLETLLGGADAARDFLDGARSEQENDGAFRTLKVHFKDQEAVDRFAFLLRQSISADDRSLDFPA